MRNNLQEEKEREGGGGWCTQLKEFDQVFEFQTWSHLSIDDTSTWAKILHLLHVYGIMCGDSH